MGCWDDGGGWVRVGVRGWATSSSGRTAPRSGNMYLSGRYPEHDICEDFNAIDVRELQRKTQMRPGLCFITEWFRDGAPPPSSQQPMLDPESLSHEPSLAGFPGTPRCS